MMQVCEIKALPANCASYKSMFRIHILTYWWHIINEEQVLYKWHRLVEQTNLNWGKIDNSSIAPLLQERLEQD